MYTGSYQFVQYCYTSTYLIEVILVSSISHRNGCSRASADDARLLGLSASNLSNKSRGASGIQLQREEIVIDRILYIKT